MFNYLPVFQLNEKFFFEVPCGVDLLSPWYSKQVFLLVSFSSSLTVLPSRAPSFQSALHCLGPYNDRKISQFPYSFSRKQQPGQS
jgi:hypothetical protein